MKQQNTAKWESLLGQVESTLTDVLQTVTQREESFAEQSAASESSNEDATHEKVEGFDKRLTALQNKAERAQEFVNQLDCEWAGGEKRIRDHLDRLDALTPKLQGWLGG